MKWSGAGAELKHDSQRRKDMNRLLQGATESRNYWERLKGWHL
jgi:hypothetical protein